MGARRQAPDPGKNSKHCLQALSKHRTPSLGHRKMLRSQGPDASIHRRNRSLISRPRLGAALDPVGMQAGKISHEPLTKLCSSTSSRLGRVSDKAGRFPAYDKLDLRSNESLLTRFPPALRMAATSSLASSTRTDPLGILLRNFPLLCLPEKALNAPLEAERCLRSQLAISSRPHQKDRIESNRGDCGHRDLEPVN